MSGATRFDMAFIGHYTKDTIIYPGRETTQDGGPYRYGARAARALGLSAAVITRLAREDRRSLDELEQDGVQTFVRESPRSTCLDLIYPTDNPDERIVRLTSQADPFTVEDVAGIEARAFHVGPSIRGEVPGEVVRALAGRGVPLSLDAQGYIRVVRDGELYIDAWAESRDILPYVNVFKVDAAEAETMTGERDIHAAAQRIAALGPREVLLTHRGGVLVWAGGQAYEAPFVARSLAGRTGRGDTCTATYMAKRLQGASPAEACIWAAALTSLKIEEPGPFRRPIADVEALIRERYAAG